MKNIEELTNLVRKFRDDRDWKQFHNPKDCALSLVLEAAEVMEHFQWKSKEEIESYIKTNKQEIGEELADVLYWVLLLSYDLEIDLSAAFVDKLEKSGKKYPIEKSKGSNKKYTQL